MTELSQTDEKHRSGITDSGKALWTPEGDYKGKSTMHLMHWKPDKNRKQKQQSPEDKIVTAKSYLTN